MQYAPLGKNGPVVSRIGFGTWQTIAQTVGKSESQKCISAAYEIGINFFDTADVYGYGDAERFLGDCLSFLDREKVVLGTKCFFPNREGNGGLSRAHILRSVDSSLKNLKTDYLDLMQCHRFDTETPLEETIGVLHDLIQKGKILHWGVSRWDSNQMNDAVAICSARGWQRPVSNQLPYNLFNISLEGAIEISAKQNGISLVAYSPLAQGVLTGKYKDLESPPEGSRASSVESQKTMWDFSAEKLAKVDKLSMMAAKYGISLSQMALAWCLRKSTVASVLIGASRPEQVLDNAKCLEIQLTDGQLAEIEVIMDR